MKGKIKTNRGRPLKGEARRIRTSVTLPPEQIRWLEEQALLLNTTKSELLSRLIDETQYLSSETSTLLHLRFPISEKVLKHFCQRYHVKKLAVFGSILQEDFGPDSDVDILVEFNPENTPTYFTITRMADELSKLLGGRKVDIKTPSELSIYFRAEIVQNAEVIYAA